MDPVPLANQAAHQGSAEPISLEGTGMPLPTSQQVLHALAEVGGIHSVATKEYAKNIQQQLECWCQLKSLRKRESQLNRLIQEARVVLNHQPSNQ